MDFQTSQSSQEDTRIEEFFRSRISNKSCTNGITRDIVVNQLMNGNTFRFTEQAMHRYKMFRATISGVVMERRPLHSGSVGFESNRLGHLKVGPEFQRAIDDIRHSYPDIFNIFKQVETGQAMIKALICGNHSELVHKLSAEEEEPTATAELDDTGYGLLKKEHTPAFTHERTNIINYFSPTSDIFHLPKDALSLPGIWIIYTKDVSGSGRGVAARVSLSIRPSKTSSLSIWCSTLHNYTNWLAEKLNYSPNRHLLVAIFKDESGQMRRRRVLDDLTFQAAIQDACLAGQSTFQFHMVARTHSLSGINADEVDPQQVRLTKEDLARIEYCALQCHGDSEITAISEEIERMKSWKRTLQLSGSSVPIPPYKYQDFKNHGKFSVPPEYLEYRLEETSLKKWFFPLLIIDSNNNQQYSSISVEVWMAAQPDANNLSINCWSFEGFKEFLTHQLGFNSVSQDIVHHRFKGSTETSSPPTESKLQNQTDFRLAVEHDYTSKSDVCIFYLKSSKSACKGKSPPPPHLVNSPKCSVCEHRYLLKYRDRHQFTCLFIKEKLKRNPELVGVMEDEDIAMGGL